jgi:hypothetical protein
MLRSLSGVLEIVRQSSSRPEKPSSSPAHMITAHSPIVADRESPPQPDFLFML